MNSPSMNWTVAATRRVERGVVEHRIRKTWRAGHSFEFANLQSRTRGDVDEDVLGCPREFGETQRSQDVVEFDIHVFVLDQVKSEKA
jgi:hypothetical protein